MKCAQVQEHILTDYSDHELPRVVHDSLRHHIAACPACQAVEKRLHTLVIDPLARIPLQKAPADLWQRIQSRIRVEESIRSPWYQHFLPGMSMVPKFALAAGLLVAVAAGGLLVHTRAVATKNAHEAALCVAESMYHMDVLSGEEEPENDTNIESIL
jgi:anti-sigma factor RsiW